MTTALKTIDPRSADPEAEALRRRYFELRDLVLSEFDSGRIEQAHRLSQEALAVAQQCDDPELVDMAFCNQSAMEINLGHHDEPCNRLRMILMRNRTPEVAFAAAYNLSFAYENRKAFKKALFYAQVSRDRALASAQAELIAKAHNQVGQCLLAESYFEKAAEEYHEALRYLPNEPSVPRAAVLGNLGYTKVILGNHREGFRLLFQAVRWYRRAGLRTYEAGHRLQLCYAYSEVERFERARAHGRRSLELAEESGDYEVIKYSLFLLGEVERSLGNYDEAWDYFERLQHEFYPHEPQLPEIMLLLETRQIVNLRA